MLNPLSEVLSTDVMIDSLDRQAVLDDLFMQIQWNTPDLRPVRFEDFLGLYARSGIRISQATKLSLIRSCTDA